MISPDQLWSICMHYILGPPKSECRISAFFHIFDKKMFFRIQVLAKFG